MAFQRQRTGLQVSRLLQRISSRNAPTSSALQLKAYGTIEDKGRSEENVKFRKEDERLLRQLLNKVKQAADTVDIHGAESSKNVELSALKEILAKYNVSDDDLQKVLQWKHASI